jgi:hypothetical protein
MIFGWIVQLSVVIAREGGRSSNHKTLRPAHVHERVVGMRPTRGDQAVALGFDIGGRVAGVHP